MREIVFDTETTGLDPKTGDRLVEFGALELINRIPTERIFHAYYNPERDMPAGAEAVHGLSALFLSDKPLFADKVDELLEFLGDSPLIAHNASFDFGFLNAELARCGHDPIAMDRMVDTLVIARKKHPGAKNSLDALCSRYGVDRSHRVKHGALLDAELLAQVYVELTGGLQMGMSLDADAPSAAEDTKDSSVSGIKAAKVYREPRPHSASFDELAAHHEFVAKIAAPLWSNKV